jgi:glycosyltransferase involved in cell wall biosynthesis
MHRRDRVRLVIFLNNFEPGGTERQMSELICRLDPSRFEVNVACLSRRGALHDRVAAAAASVNEYPISTLKSVRTAAQALRFARWCRAAGIALVHTCDFYSNVFALPPATLARIPVRIGSRRDVSIPERTPGQQRLQRLAYRCAHRVVTNAGASAAKLMQEGVPAGQIEQISNGIDLSRHAAAAVMDGRSVTTVAHLRPGKGIDVLLKAAAALLTRLPDVTFRIAGDGTERPALQALCTTLGISERVQFLGHTPDIPALLRSSSVFAFPSLMEASPNAVIEAMASGLAVAASNAGGIPEVVEHERNGLLVPPGDPRALSDALVRLLTDTALSQKLGIAARETIARRFSFERMVDAFERLYIDELKRRAPERLPERVRNVLPAGGSRSADAAHRDGIPHALEQFESKTLQ